ncbi:peptide ABC transporter substrate-binding protein [Paenibacillus sp. PK3_47]|uniref:peptide ABC transporter substrate-binding protein n=1 Tax=Paenibacillus sp. PK3_47 TaxID=2072642 RepID=UPI00201E3D3E|nr:peptide ABC transporter substrate-binding protein [Paenibacillus sp. PK3_47]UQZ32895.1 peptide ABC transporter substrate-binding protein [Paenibacillus sp. PK3_47]
MKKSKSLLLMIALVLVIGTVLAGCGGNNAANSGNNASPTNAPATDNAGNTNTGTDGEEKLAADQTLKINLSSEPPTFDPQQAQDSTSNAILKLMYEGLTRQNAETGQAEEGMAESWEISPDGLVYTFKIRDAQWSNGDPVTANDFAFAWQRVLDPNAEQAAPYAYQLYYIKGAEDFNTGKITDFSQVGVKVIDDKTLEVTLANPTPYFLGLLSFYTYYPVHSSAADNAKWATTVETQITNGPFTLTEWTTGQSLAVTKNPNYYAADQIKAQAINFSIVNSGATELLSYKNGELDRAGGPIGEIPTEQLPIVEKELPNEFVRKGIASVYYYQFNVTEKPFTNAKIRKALAMAIERQPIIDNITLGGQIPAFGFVPPGIQSNGEEFRTSVDDSQYFGENVEEAKTLLAEGLAEEGLDKLSFTLSYNTSEGHQKIAVAVADMWKKALGVEVKLENKEWGVFLEDKTNLNYQVARAGWSADYNDPMTYLDMWVTGGGNNDTGYSNPAYDKLIQEAKTSSDNAVRQEKFAAAEKLIMDDMIVIPIYYYTNNSLNKEYLKGVTLDFSGAIDLSRAYLLEH